MNYRIKFGLKAIYILLFIISILIFIGFSSMYKLAPSSYEVPIHSIDRVRIQIENETAYEVSLPTKIKELPAHTRVVLSADINTNAGDKLQIKSVFSPIKLYVDDLLTYEAGQEGTYPSYMNDPPTILTTVLLPDKDGSSEIRIEYLSPSQRSELSLPLIFVGNETAILTNQFKTNGFSFSFSLILIFLGLFMVFISLTVVRHIPVGKSFLWLGLFSLSGGIWVLGECDYTAFILPYPILLYNMAYLGLFSVAIPFLHFGLILLNPKTKLPFKIMLTIQYMALTAAIVLQLLGMVDFIKSLYLFHIITPSSFIVFAFSLIYEYFRYGNPMVKRFALATSLLTVSTIVELLNYWVGFTDLLTIFFQIGVLTFVIALSIISGHYIKETVLTAAEKSRLEFEMSTLGKQLELQQNQYLKMAEDDSTVKAQRHDLRHQLTVLRDLNKQKDHSKLEEYIDTLIIKIPSDRELRLCENYAVNAVASYYDTLASNSGIDVNLCFAIPRLLEPLVESDLCIIIGNLLENAIEACNRMEGKGKFMKLQSYLEYDTLVLIMENSFEGDIKKKDDTILSSKRDGEGIGLSSIQAIVNRQGGSTRFEAKGGVFTASLYLQLDTYKLEEETSS